MRNGWYASSEEIGMVSWVVLALGPWGLGGSRRKGKEETGKVEVVLPQTSLQFLIIGEVEYCTALLLHVHCCGHQHPTALHC